MVKKYSRQYTDKKSVNNYYIALENLDFTWNEKQIKRVISYWQSGYHIEDIADKVERIIDEVAILIMDLMRKGKIDERVGAVFGSKGGN